MKLFTVYSHIFLTFELSLVLSYFSFLCFIVSSLFLLNEFHQWSANFTTLFKELTFGFVYHLYYVFYSFINICSLFFYFLQDQFVVPLQLTLEAQTINFQLFFLPPKYQFPTNFDRQYFYYPVLRDAEMTALLR